MIRSIATNRNVLFTFIYLIIFILVISLLAGCNKVQDQATVVKLPIATNPTSIIVPKRPLLPIQKLNDQSKSSDIIKAYVDSVDMLLMSDSAFRELVDSFD